MVRCASLFKISGKNEEQMAGAGLKKDNILGRLSFRNVESLLDCHSYTGRNEKKGVMGCERGKFVLDIFHSSCLHYCLSLHQYLLSAGVYGIMTVDLVC